MKRSKYFWKQQKSRKEKREAVVNHDRSHLMQRGNLIMALVNLCQLVCVGLHLILTKPVVISMWLSITDNGLQQTAECCGILFQPDCNAFERDTFNSNGVINGFIIINKTQWQMCEFPQNNNYLQITWNRNGAFSPKVMHGDCRFRVLA